MLGILSITAPIFALVGLGYALTRGGLFRPADMRIMGSFVLNIALPALLFNAIASRPIGEVLHPAYMLTYLSGALATLILAYLWAGAIGQGPARRAIAAMGSSCPNSGFVGYPVMLLVLPDIAGVILAMNMIVENFILIPICLTLLDLSRPRKNRSVPRMVANLFAGLLKRPLILALIAALAVSALALPVPEVVTRTLGMLAGAAGALSLFVIGGSLVGLPIRGEISLAAQIVAGKLLLHPALTAVSLALLPMIGLATLPTDLHMAVLLTAAMPMFGIYTIIAQDSGHEGLASVALLGATTLAFFTLSALLLMLT